MITTLHATRSDAATSAMPLVRCAEAWLRALPVSVGDVSLQGTGAFRDRIDAAGLTFPGTRAWSPPT